MCLSDSKCAVPQMTNEYQYRIYSYVMSDKVKLTVKVGESHIRGRGAKTLAAIGRKLSPQPSMQQPHYATLV